MNRQTLRQSLYESFLNRLPLVEMSGASMTKDTPDWLYCDCGLELDITENYQMTITGEKDVFNRVRACRSCKKIDFGDGVWQKGSVA